MLYFGWTAVCDETLPFLLFRKPCLLVVLREKLNRGKTSSILIRRVFLSRPSNSPMERLEEGFSWKRNLKRKSFSWVIGGRGEQLKSPTLTTWWKFRRERTQCSLTLPMRRTLAWRGLSTRRTNQLPPTVEWKKWHMATLEYFFNSHKVCPTDWFRIVYRLKKVLKINIEYFWSSLRVNRLSGVGWWMNQVESLPYKLLTWIQSGRGHPLIYLANRNKQDCVKSPINA